MRNGGRIGERLELDRDVRRGFQVSTQSMANRTEVRSAVERVRIKESTAWERSIAPALHTKYAVRNICTRRNRRECLQAEGPNCQWHYYT